MIAVVVWLERYGTVPTERLVASRVLWVGVSVNDADHADLYPPDPRESSRRQWKSFKWHVRLSPCSYVSLDTHLVS